LDEETVQLFQTLKLYVERIQKPGSSGFSKQECFVLALQCLNRINQKIGHEARSRKDETEFLRLFQARVNGVTRALKSENLPMLGAAMASLEGFIQGDKGR
jgi:hypothetical protein